MRYFMQVTFLRAWLLLALNWLVTLCGQELVTPGCRQIPKDFSDFDPKLADYFKSRGMKNGKHMTLAMDYAAVARWNHFNKKRGKDERAYGTDYAFEKKWGADVSRQTWGRHMDELAALGLVRITTVQNQPAYQALPYRMVNGGLTFTGNSHEPNAQSHEPSVDSHEPKGTFHERLNIESKALIQKDLETQSSPTPPTRDADADGVSSETYQEILDHKPDIPERRDVSAEVDGCDELWESRVESPRPNPPVPPRPPSPDDDTQPDDQGDMAALRAFFTGCTVAEVRAMIERHGEQKIFDTIRAVSSSPNVRSPVAVVRYQLAIGGGGASKLPEQADPDYASGNGHSYITGKYADFIHH